MSSSEGTKVTKDPRATNEPKVENPGLVTSDSLAAESITSGGEFAAGSDARGPMQQPSFSSTAATTDTSNAVVLDAAPDAPSRADDEAYEPVHASRGAATSGLSSTGAGDAAVPEVKQQPKGKNLEEGGFDSDAPNASFTAEIGSKNDPGRIALKKFEQDNTPHAGVIGDRQSAVDNENQYANLGNERA